MSAGEHGEELVGCIPAARDVIYKNGLVGSTVTVALGFDYQDRVDGAVPASRSSGTKRIGGRNELVLKSDFGAFGMNENGINTKEKAIS